MELREMIRLFWSERKLFLGVLGASLAIGVFLRLVQPVSYEAELTMNVARFGMRETNEYAYDDFYRLQADERFADTVVRWLESPRILSEIAREAKWREGTLRVSAGRLSSQVIRVRFFVSKSDDASGVSRATFRVLNRETASLNVDANPSGWFSLVGETPSVADARIPLSKVLAFSALLGIFFGFWGVLLKRYTGGNPFFSIRRGRASS